MSRGFIVEPAQRDLRLVYVHWFISHVATVSGNQCERRAYHGHNCLSRASGRYDLAGCLLHAGSAHRLLRARGKITLLRPRGDERRRVPVLVTLVERAATGVWRRDGIGARLLGVSTAPGAP